MIVLALTLSLSINAISSSAYTDMSTYKIETGKFINEQEVSRAIEQLKSDTGWSGSYERTDEIVQYYQLISGGFKGEDKVKQALQQFQQGTGIISSYEPTGDYAKEYQIITGGFIGVDKVDKALTEFQISTGINAVYQPTGNYTQYYQIITGDIKGEDKVKQGLQDFQTSTGIQASYESTGNSELGKMIITGGFLGEEKVKKALDLFQSTTSLKASYEPTGTYEATYQIISGGYKGEENVKKALEEFSKATGFSGTYESTGKFENRYQIISGGFEGEERVKAALQELKDSTGITGTYEPIGDKTNMYSITTGGIIGETKVATLVQELKKELFVEARYEQIPGSSSYRIIMNNVSSVSLSNVESYMKSRNWWYSTPQLIGTGYSHFRILTDELNQSNRDLGLQFFESKGWYASAQTSNPIYTYNIISDSLIKSNLDKGLKFFQSKGWWATSKATSEKINYYRIKTAPLVQVDVQKGLTFFSQQGWWATSQATNERIYSYRIKTGSILDSEVQKGLKFFSNIGWWATSQSTEKVPSYKIISDPLTKEALDRGLQYMNNRGWWATYSTSTTNFYRIKTSDLLQADAERGLTFFESKGWWGAINPSTTNQPFQIVLNDILGYDQALAMQQKINSLYGWNVTLTKTKNGPQLMYTDYGLTLSSMLEKQLEKYPQTDKYRNDPRYVHADFVDLSKQIITGDGVNLRTSPSTDGTIVQQMNTGDQVLVIGKTGDWVEVRLTWQNAFASDVQYYLDPNNFSLNSKSYFQFLKLSQPANLNASEVNEKILSGKGILAGKGQAFIDAANKYNINDVYLISHALLETGNGTSSLANGVVVNGKTVYNMFGYGAVDSCPITCGAQTAYDNGWFTPEAAIIGGAQFISSDYIYNSTFPQDTLFKMRWNPVQTWHQYATDIGWAYKQVDNIYNLYQLLDNYTLYYDIPKYR